MFDPAQAALTICFCQDWVPFLTPSRLLFGLTIFLSLPTTYAHATTTSSTNTSSTTTSISTSSISLGTCSISTCTGGFCEGKRGQERRRESQFIEAQLRFSQHRPEHRDVRLGAGRRVPRQLQAARDHAHLQRFEEERGVEAQRRRVLGGGQTSDLCKRDLSPSDAVRGGAATGRQTA